MDLGQRAVGLCHGALQFFLRAGKQHHGDRLRAACHLAGHHHRAAHASLRHQRGLQVGGMDVHPRAGHNHVSLAPQKSQFARRVLLRQVAGGQPLALARAHPSASPRRPAEHLAAHQDLALAGDLHLASRQWLPDRPRRNVEGMVQRYQRGGLRHAVALDQRKSQPVPEGFQVGWQRRSARDHRPELPSQRAVYAAKDPPPPPNRKPRRRVQLRRQRGESPQQMRAQQMFAPDQLGHARRLKLLGEVYLGDQQRGAP